MINYPTEDDFNDWLFDHLDILNKYANMTLKPIKRESKVYEFFIDILAKNEKNENVIIESQFGFSDHSHLGQILTYCTGLKAKTIIWIAENWDNAHLDAVEYLNQNSELKILPVMFSNNLDNPNFSKPIPRENERTTIPYTIQEEIQKRFWAKLLSEFKKIDQFGVIKREGGNKGWWKTITILKGCKVLLAWYFEYTNNIFGISLGVSQTKEYADKFYDIFESNDFKQEIKKKSPDTTFERQGNGDITKNLVLGIYHPNLKNGKSLLQSLDEDELLSNEIINWGIKKMNEFIPIIKPYLEKNQSQLKTYEKK